MRDNPGARRCAPRRLGDLGGFAKPPRSGYAAAGRSVSQGPPYGLALLAGVYPFNSEHQSVELRLESEIVTPVAPPVGELLDEHA